MYKIVQKRELNKSVFLMEIEAPFIAKKALAGQFIIFRIDEKGERVPLTIADYDREKGTITIIFQIAGMTTERLATLSEGDALLDVTGPLGIPTHLDENVKKVCVVGGGVGCAIAYPQAKQLFNDGIAVDVIAGFRNKDIVILEEEFSKVCDNFYLATDDGSKGTKGFVTNILKEQIDNGAGYDAVIAIGPIPMMKFVCEVTRPYGIKTIVSLNPIMVDGTGMCGGCRVTVDGKIRYACVEGPDFDGHLVDFDELSKRNSVYREQEHECRMMKLAGGENNA